MVWLGPALPGLSRQGGHFGKAGMGLFRRGMARPDQAFQSQAVRGPAWFGVALYEDHMNGTFPFDKPGSATCRCRSGLSRTRP